jgi:hypothetical protein
MIAESDHVCGQRPLGSALEFISTAATYCTSKGARAAPNHTIGQKNQSVALRSCQPATPNDDIVVFAASLFKHAGSVGVFGIDARYHAAERAADLLADLRCFFSDGTTRSDVRGIVEAHVELTVAL